MARPSSGGTCMCGTCGRSRWPTSRAGTATAPLTGTGPTKHKFTGMQRETMKQSCIIYFFYNSLPKPVKKFMYPKVFRLYVIFSNIFIFEY